MIAGLLAALVLASGDVPPPPDDFVVGSNGGNPATRACLDRGGRSETRRGRGGESSVCHLRDGRTCEQWALFRGEGCRIAADIRRPGDRTTVARRRR